MALCNKPPPLLYAKTAAGQSSVCGHYNSIAFTSNSLYRKANIGVSRRRTALTCLDLPNSNSSFNRISKGCARSARLTVRADATLGATEPDPLSSRLSHFADAFWRFLRPHTIRGTALGSIALVSKALIENSHLINWWLLPKALCGLIALICGNGYIVGINQIYDIGIDKVNKPFLPIAAGDLSVPEAWFLVLLFVAMGVAIVGVNFGPFITALYSFGLFLGTIYSVPPFRMKRFPVAAFLIIAMVRGFLLNFGVYYATRAALGLEFQWSPPVVFITIFVTVFAMVIAITKDLPDVEGDRKFQISTLATNLGVRNITFLGSGLLLANYIGAILAAVYMPQTFQRTLMVSGHALLAVLLGFQTWILDQSNYTKVGPLIGAPILVYRSTPPLILIHFAVSYQGIADQRSIMAVVEFSRRQRILSRSSEAANYPRKEGQ